jgi:hypothetical protein
MTNNQPPAAKPPADLVEAVARSLAKVANANWDAADFLRTPAGETPEEMREGFMQSAQAAIAAHQAYMASEGVTDMDREAAADAVGAYREQKNGDWQGRIRKGECDDGYMVQAFAAHRRAAAGGKGDGFSPDDAWQELVEKDDRTSPSEYPDMALITREELAEFMGSAATQSDASDALVAELADAAAQLAGWEGNSDEDNLALGRLNKTVVAYLDLAKSEGGV